MDQQGQEGSIKSELTVKSNPTIKREFTESRSYLLLDFTIKLYNILIEIKKRGLGTAKTIKTLLTLLNSTYGPDVLLHLHKYQAFTFREFEVSLVIPKGTISYISTRLLSIGLIEEVVDKKTLKPLKPHKYSSFKGPGPRLWMIPGAPKDRAGECLERHYSRIKTKKISLLEDDETVSKVVEHFIEKLNRGFDVPKQSALIEYLKDFHPEVQPRDRLDYARLIVSKLDREFKAIREGQT